MAVIRYKCTVCDRTIEIIERPTGLERIGPCVITDKCRGSLYKLDRLEDFAVGQFPEDVSGLTNYIKRNVLYDHTQAIAEQEWLVEHNLGVNPSVQVVVNREEIVDGVVVNTRPEIEPQLITLIDANTLTILFDRPESGLAQVLARSSAFTQTVEAADPGITYLPASQSNILTVAVDCESGQFPAGSVSGTQLVRLYYLDQETLDATAFDSAVFQDYEARSPISTSAWNDTSEIFVNGQLYTVLTIDIGDPVNDIGAPSAGAVLFQAGTATTAFPYDQAPNMVVLLSDPPHANVDKNRRQLFRPELNVGPALALDSFIFASGELLIDQTKVEDTFPPIFSVSNTQDCPVPEAPVTPAEPAFVIMMTDFDGEGAADSYQITSDGDITTWVGPIDIPGDVGALTFFVPTDMAYMSGISTWVGTSTKATSRVFYSDDDAVTWTIATPAIAQSHFKVDVGLILGVEYAVAITDDTGGNMGTAYTTDGINWSIGNGGGGLIGAGDGIGIRYTGDRWIVVDSEGAYWSMTDPTAAWPAQNATPLPDTSVADKNGALHSINGGSRVFFGADSSTKIWYSDDDGDSWNVPSFTNGITGLGLVNVSAFADNDNGTVIAAGGNYGVGGSPREGYYYLSTDSGLSWTETELPIYDGSSLLGPEDVIYDPDYGFVVVGAAFFSGAGYEMVILTSPDGITWTTRVAELDSERAGQADPQFVVSKANNRPV